MKVFSKILLGSAVIIISLHSIIPHIHGNQEEELHSYFRADLSSFLYSFVNSIQHDLGNGHLDNFSLGDEEITSDSDYCHQINPFHYCWGEWCTYDGNFPDRGHNCQYEKSGIEIPYYFLVSFQTFRGPPSLV